jgi:hypothetical protein
MGPEGVPFSIRVWQACPRGEPENRAGRRDPGGEFSARGNVGGEALDNRAGHRDAGGAFSARGNLYDDEIRGPSMLMSTAKELFDAS